MSAPFQPGDVVVCVENDTVAEYEWQPQVRQNYRVARIGEAVDQASGSDRIAVGLRDDPRGHEYGWPVEWFRKIDAADESFIASIRACKPTTAPRLNPARHSRELMK